jgi:hypothetical protein
MTTKFVHVETTASDAAVAEIMPDAGFTVEPGQPATSIITVKKYYRVIPTGVNSDTLAAFPASSWPA